MRPAGAPIAPLLVFGWGNASRGDDALGPLLLQRLRELHPAHPQLECLDDYQLQIEHALDLVGRQRVLFVDASRQCTAPFEVSALRPTAPGGITSHALSPQTLLQVFVQVQGRPPPPCQLLAIAAGQFELGAAPSAQALAHLEAALQWASAWVSDGSSDGSA